VTIGRRIVPKIRVPEDGLGPCMLALTPAMRAYVVARVIYGLGRSRAAEAAGYATPDKNTAKSQGYRLEHDERIQAAIAEECRKLMRSEGPNCIRTLISIRDNPKAENKDRLKATEALLSRCGLGVVNESYVLVEHQLSDAERDRRILAAAAELGLPLEQVQKALIDPKNVVDAEYSEVPAAEDAPQTPEEEAAKAERNRENARRRELRAASPEERARLKAEALAHRIAAQKAKYAAAQGGQVDLEEYIAGQEADDLSDLMAPTPGGEQ